MVPFLLEYLSHCLIDIKLLGAPLPHILKDKQGLVQLSHPHQSLCFVKFYEKALRVEVFSLFKVPKSFELLVKTEVGGPDAALDDRVAAIDIVSNGKVIKRLFVPFLSHINVSKPPISEETLLIHLSCIKIALASLIVLLTVHKLMATKGISVREASIELD